LVILRIKKAKKIVFLFLGIDLIWVPTFVA
jgi:hypothetical protein